MEKLQFPNIQFVCQKTLERKTKQLEANNKKKEKGFSEDLQNSGPDWHEVMLATKWEDYGDQLNDKTVCVSPKLDGHRCLAYLKNGEVYLQSRGGKEITSCNHLKQHLKENVFNEYPDVILDGELYNHNVPFEILCGLIRRKEASYDSYKVQYHIYDVFGKYMKDISFTERYLFVSNLTLPSEFFVIVETVYVERDLQKLVEYEMKYISDNYEGMMVRDPKSFYENGKRSKGLLKMKRFQDEEFPIVEINDGLGNRKNLATEVVVKLSDGREFSAGIMGQDEYVRQMFLDRERYVGKLATIKFQGKSEYGIPRFPKMKSVREDKF